MRRPLVFALLLASASPAFAKNQFEKALELTPEYFQKVVVVKDDDLDTSATLSSVKGFQEKRGLLGITWNDNFLRATINKKTGETRIGLYQFVNYYGEWRRYQGASYETHDGPKDADLRIVDRRVVSCQNTQITGGCLLSEHMIFDVDEELLRVIASKWEANKAAVWRFKFRAQAADDWNDGIPPAEVKGFLMAVDAYRKDHGLPSPQPASH